MKKIFIPLFIAMMSSTSFAMTLANVVMMEDYSETPILQSFPCSEYIGVISCDAPSLYLEKNCKNTLQFKNDTFSCVSLSGKFVDFAQVNRNQKFEDETLPGTRGYYVTFSANVKLEEYTTPGGNKEYTLVIE